MRTVCLCIRWAVRDGRWCWWVAGGVLYAAGVLAGVGR